jgi:hypothetical protein
MLAVAERAIAADSCCSGGCLLRPRIAARPWHLMTGAVHVIPAIARLRGKDNAAEARSSVVRLGLFAESPDRFPDRPQLRISEHQGITRLSFFGARSWINTANAAPLSKGEPPRPLNTPT